MQFLGQTKSSMPSTLGTAEVHFFAWLVIQNHVWMADMLESRGGKNVEDVSFVIKCKNPPPTTLFQV
jgi:hypothetical protein